MKFLDLTIRDANGPAPLRFPVRRVVNGGYTGRNQQAVRPISRNSLMKEFPRPGRCRWPFPS